MIKKKGGGQIMSENINHIKTNITVKSRERPQNMSEKIQLLRVDKKIKKEGEGSKYVGEH